ncbi:MAG: N-acetylmuramic acid 6-phosphate etherase [Anaerolineae bacterium]
MEDLAQLTTEQDNPASQDLDKRSSAEIVSVINLEDARVAHAVRTELPKIAEAVDVIVERMRRGGRLIYVGAGTSGRIAAMDAMECVPSFGVPEDRIRILLAGGEQAMFHSVEGAEDDTDAARRAIDQIEVGPDDAVIGVAASGRTPYVLSAMREAKARGAAAIGIVNNRATPMHEVADVTIATLTGPEVVTGATRMKAGTAQKMVLNTLTTATFIRLGKVYSNQMVDVKAVNSKLRHRARRILMSVAKVDPVTADTALAEADYDVKVAVVMLLANVSAEEARDRLRAAGGYVRRAAEQKQGQHS